MPKSYLKTVYYFDELSDDAKEKAREWMREGALDYEWYDCVYDDSKEIAQLMGIDITNIYFSGFSSQGDGACFEGSYEYRKNSVKAVKEYAPLDTELHRIASELAKIQRKYFYGLTANVKHSGHYNHKYCTDINVWQVVYWNGYSDNYANDEATEAITELLRDFMEWIYRQLEKDYEYLMSDESIDETIRINEYTFNETGTREN